MALTDEEIVHLTRLARLELAPDERTRLGAQLNDIVAYTELLNEVDVEGVEPMVHAIPTPLRRRDDVAGDVVGRRALEGSAGFEDGLVRVPKIVE